MLTQLVAKETNKSFTALTSSKTNEWLTPQNIIVKTRKVLGTIDLDPASNEYSQSYIKANRYHTQENDGYIVPWDCETMFMNPPYGQKSSKSGNRGASDWLVKAHTAYKNGIIRDAAIVIARGDSTGIKLLQKNYLFLIANRIKFLLPDGESGNIPVPGTFIFS